MARISAGRSPASAADNRNRGQELKLFVGLGNPGAKHARHRHNVGYMAVDRIAEDHGFGPWRSKFQGVISEGRLGQQKVVLLKPETFMNNSGQSVGEALRFFKLDSEDAVIFHDEIDLAPGKLRVKQGGGHAGHNGLRDIIGALGSRDFYRLRIYCGVVPDDADGDGKADLDADGNVTNFAQIQAEKYNKPIYEVFGYINGGNWQIHPLTGFDLRGGN